MSDLPGLHFDLLNGGLDTSKYQTMEELDNAKRALFFKRFNVIYDVSPFILAQIMYEENNSILNDYINSRCGITIDDEVIEQRHGKVSLLLDLEQHFIQRFHSLPSSMELFSWHFSNESSYLELRKKIKENDCDVGENIYDISMRTLLNIVYQYIRSQDKHTRVYSVFNTVEVNRSKEQRGIDKSYLKDSIISDKLRVLKKFLEVINFHNNNLGICIGDDLPDISAFFKYKKSTLLGPKVLEDDLDELIRQEDIEELYFLHHKEMKWNILGKCQSNDIFKDKLSCGNDFYLSENSIFHLDGHFYQMCPKCGCITDVSSSIKIDEVKNRIINRTDTDEQIFKRSSLLSELYFLDKDYKTLIKK